MSTALLLIDVQRNMLQDPQPVPGADRIRTALECLLEKARRRGAVIVHVQNSGSQGDPDEPGIAGWELVFEPMAGELVVQKTQPDTFASNPDLEGELKQLNVSRLVVAGMQSNYCVAATSRAGLQRGFEVFLASGAHATYDEDKPAGAISSDVEVDLAKEGVVVIPAADAGFD
jgi:nicotinamidase-related amidase